MSCRIAFMITCLLLLACEDVIDVDLPETETRLIVNGLARVNLGDEFVPIAIQVTKTNGFFEEPTVTELERAVVLVGEPNPDSPDLLNLSPKILKEFVPGTGLYEPDTVGTVDDRIRTEFLNPNTVFFLIIEHEGKRYAAQTNYVPAVPIDNAEQGFDTLFDEDDTEIKVTFTDIPEEKNHYVFDFGLGEFLAVDDQFIDGQQFEFSYFLERDAEAGDQIEISLMGADQQFFNYIDLLVEQTQDDGGVFETPAVTPRGNVFDITGLDNIEIFDNVQRPESFALGYFAVVQEYKYQITLQ
ncbi:DUF4249 domain-containing protein [Muricauda sp. 2012CJ35-5]|uniref:DUF4249 domain-containing protein n=1 Tax=Flagellimonas spongiicola TaxID=2942208 RepID=A0ABT0PP95_9FLAO|nr:DUF4249 family protein [Allomuricauda spongiicola]MCL6273051.1 DUF4249 domain-containing protein [Allomuricauda spongiicola]